MQKWWRSLRLKVFLALKIGVPLKIRFHGTVLQNVSCGSHLGNYVGVNANDTMIEKSTSKLIGNFNYLMSIGYEIKYKLFKTFYMDLYGCVLWNLTGNCINTFFTTWRKCIHQLLGNQVLVNDIPMDAQVHKRFLNFFESLIKSSNPVVKLCGQLVLSGSRTTVCKSLNYIWSKYNVIVSKSDKNSYTP